MKINELKENVINEINLLVNSLEVKKSKKGDDYAKIIFSDGAVDIISFVWNVDSNNLQYDVGKVYKIFCYKQEFNNNSNIKIMESELVTDEKVISSFVKSSILPSDTIKEYIFSEIENIEDTILREFTKSVIMKYEVYYFDAPAAAKNHHAYKGGMSYHVYNMLKVLKLFNNEVRKDFLISGIILHDIGKCFELKNDMVISYTTPGELLGHISIGYEIIYEEMMNQSMNIDKYRLLLDLIISHHGKLEYGNMKLSDTHEEDIINLIDTIDANINAFIERLENININNWSENIFPLSGRKILKHNENTIFSNDLKIEGDIYYEISFIYSQRYDKICLDLINISKTYSYDDLIISFEKLIEDKEKYTVNDFRLIKHIILSRDLDLSNQSPILPKIIEAELFGSAWKIIKYNEKVENEKVENEKE